MLKHVRVKGMVQFVYVGGGLCFYCYFLFMGEQLMCIFSVCVCLEERKMCLCDQLCTLYDMNCSFT